jgi:hypothetical protein
MAVANTDLWGVPVEGGVVQNQPTEHAGRWAEQLHA